MRVMLATDELSVASAVEVLASVMLDLDMEKAARADALYTTVDIAIRTPSVPRASSWTC